MRSLITTEITPLLGESIGALSKVRSGEFADKQAAARLLNNVDCCAVPCFISVISVVGDLGCVLWEPESIWSELRDKQVDLPPINCDKFMAANTILYDDLYHYDAAVFENTVLAFSGLPVVSGAVQAAEPHEMSWGAVEAEIFSKHAGNGDEYDYEPVTYMAISLHRAGFMLAPEMLAVAQDELTRMNTNGDLEVGEIKSAWDEITVAQAELLEEQSDTPIVVQLARLYGVHRHLEHRLNALQTELAALYSTS